MTSESPNSLGCMVHAVCPGSPANRVLYTDASCRIATLEHLSFTPCTSGYEFRIAPTCPCFCPGAHLFSLHIYIALYHICDTANLLFRKDGWAFVTYRIQPVDRTAWISAKAEMFLFRLVKFNFFSFGETISNFRRLFLLAVIPQAIVADFAACF